MLEEIKRKEVDKRDKHLPQTFEQLIQMYDLEKLWYYIGEILKHTDAKEGIINDKVWIKTGKNLFNKNNYIIRGGKIGFIVELEFGKTYTLSSNNPLYVAKFAEYAEQASNKVGPQKWGQFNSWVFVAGDNVDNYNNTTLFLGIQNETISSDISDFNNYNIQIEQGSIATTYEEYIPRTIYIKNNNNIYEEFSDNSKVIVNGNIMKTPLTFYNINDYEAIYKYRKVNNTDYRGSFGMGIDSNGNGATALENYKGSNLVGRIELREDGKIYNGKTNKQLVEESITVGVLTETANTFSSIDFKRVIKQGKVVQVAFRGQLSRNISPSDKFLKAPYIPNLGTNCAGALYLGGRYSADNLAWFYMDGSGYFQGVTATSGKYIHINFTYLA